MKTSKRKQIGSIRRFFVGEEKEFLLDNLSILLGSGMDVVSSLASIKDEIHSSALKLIISEMEADVSSGVTLWRALEHTKIFPKHYISLTKVGEESGKLSESLRVIADSQIKDRDFKSKVRSAMIYPSLIFFIVIVMGLAIVWIILPKLATVFESLDTNLPALTKVLFVAGVYLRTNGYIFVPSVIVILVLIFFFLFINPKTRFIGQNIMFRLPGTQKLLRESELTRFGFIFGSLLEAGLPVDEALDSLIEATTFYPYKNLYIFMKNNFEKGQSIQKTFIQYHNIKRLIPKTMQQIIVVGEQGGHLAKSLKKMSSIYENKVENTTKNFTAILEPVLLILVAIGVLVVALSVIMPIYSLIGSISP